MHMRTAVFAVLCGLAAFAGTASQAKVYECEATDNDSRIGVSPRAVVNIVDEEADKLCTFSINGFKAGSPPQDLLSEAINRLYPNNGLFVGIGQGPNAVPPEALAALLLGGGPDTDIGQMTDILSAASDALAQCLQSFPEGVEVSVETPTLTGLFSCVVTSAPEFEIGTVVVTSPELDGPAPPVLILWVQRDTVGNYLFLPQ